MGCSTVHYLLIFDEISKTLIFDEISKTLVKWTCKKNDKEKKLFWKLLKLMITKMPEL